jgi:hypothetical protein
MSAAAKPLVNGWTPEADLDRLDELADVGCCTSEGIARFLHVEWDVRLRIARGAADWLADEIDRAGGLMDEAEFLRRCCCRLTRGLQPHGPPAARRHNDHRRCPARPRSRGVDEAHGLAGGRDPR